MYFVTRVLIIKPIILLDLAEYHKLIMLIDQHTGILAFRIPVRWSINIINSVDETKILCTTPPPTQHHSFFRNYPL